MVVGADYYRTFIIRVINFLYAIFSSRAFYIHAILNKDNYLNENRACLSAFSGVKP